MLSLTKGIERMQLVGFPVTETSENMSQNKYFFSCPSVPLVRGSKRGNEERTYINEMKGSQTQKS